MSAPQDELQRLCDDVLRDMRSVSTRMSTGAMPWTDGLKELAKLYGKMDGIHAAQRVIAES